MTTDDRPKNIADYTVRDYYQGSYAADLRTYYEHIIHRDLAFIQQDCDAYLSYALETTTQSERLLIYAEVCIKDWLDKKAGVSNDNDYYGTAITSVDHFQSYGSGLSSDKFFEIQRMPTVSWQGTLVQGKATIEPVKYFTGGEENLYEYMQARRFRLWNRE